MFKKMGFHVITCALGVFIMGFAMSAFTKSGTDEMLEHYNKLTNQYCNYSEFERYAAKRVLEESSDHHMKIECMNEIN